MVCTSEENKSNVLNFRLLSICLMNGSVGLTPPSTFRTSSSPTRPLSCNQSTWVWGWRYLPRHARNNMPIASLKSVQETYGPFHAEVSEHRLLAKPSRCVSEYGVHFHHKPTICVFLLLVHQAKSVSHYRSTCSTYCQPKRAQVACCIKGSGPTIEVQRSRARMVGP